MMRAMYSGITGLKNFQTEMDIVGNNIANVNTTGFKASRITFQTTLLQTLKAGKASEGALGGTNPIQIGLGSKISSVDKVMSQGSFQNTGKKTDLAIQGDGFFVLSDGEANYFTRAGNFTLDKTGYLVNPASGFKLQGWSAKLSNTGQRYVDTNDPIGDVKISTGLVMPAKQTSAITLAHNLNTDVGLQETTMEITSKLGTKLPVKMTFSRDMKSEYRDRYVYKWNAKLVEPGDKMKFLDEASGKSDLDELNGYLELDESGNVINWVTYKGDTTNAATDTKFKILDVGGDLKTSTGADVTLTTTKSGGGAGSGATFSGNIKVTKSDGSEVYYNPADIKMDWNGTDYKITLSDVEGTNVVFDYTPADSKISTLNSDFGSTKFALANKYSIPTSNGSVTLDGTKITAKDSSDIDVTNKISDFNLSYNSASKTVTINATIDGKQLTFTNTDTNPIENPNDLATTFSSGGYTIDLSSALSGTDSLNDFSINGYNLSGFSLSGENSDTVDNFSGTYYSVREVIQPPSGGNIKLVDVSNPQNFAVVDYSNPTVSTSTLVYDALGKDYNVYTKFTKIDTNTWYWKAELADGTPLYKLNSDGTRDTSGAIAEGVIAFDGNGSIAATKWRIKDDGSIDTNITDATNGSAGFWFDPSQTGAALNPTVTPSSTAGAGPVNVEIKFNEITQFSSPHSIQVTDQDGNAQGTLDAFAINEVGDIVGTFTNGRTDKLGKVSLGVFNNPAGLLEIGNSMYAQSSNSGLAQIGVAGVGGRGTLIPGALEMSNVDLAEEFTNMIVAQRGFQATSRIITTSDAILNELVNMKR
ncbi:hypothetical protein OSSY52_22880 [Tepiditoga spiralis]|uniref:Flagellar hook protein FlgE n=1 Tax=Tepiditoga spiralis TaxID=2108365 RepID=A0A7G1GAH5_9BACT|nr:flagellar hook-basal body complex protein [Tepiditoga spiralis]BBE32147.1 hypothetical protein OSSY52_22880 [Tepiditoga spiralis]